MVNLLKRIGGALKDAVFQMFGLQAVFGPGTGAVKKAAIMEFLKNAIGVGELALGTNVALREPIGQILQDEKIPGLHIAFGHPYSEHTGATWRSSSHIDVVGRHPTILRSVCNSSCCRWSS